MGGGPQGTVGGGGLPFVRRQRSPDSDADGRIPRELSWLMPRPPRIGRQPLPVPSPPPSLTSRSAVGGGRVTAVGRRPLKVEVRRPPPPLAASRCEVHAAEPVRPLHAWPPPLIGAAPPVADRLRPPFDIFGSLTVLRDRRTGRRARATTGRSPRARGTPPGCTSWFQQPEALADRCPLDLRPTDDAGGARRPRQRRRLPHHRRGPAALSVRLRAAGPTAGHGRRDRMWIAGIACPAWSGRAGRRTLGLGRGAKIGLGGRPVVRGPDCNAGGPRGRPATSATGLGATIARSVCGSRGLRLSCGDRFASRRGAAMAFARRRRGPPGRRVA